MRMTRLILPLPPARPVNRRAFSVDMGRSLISCRGKKRRLILDATDRFSLLSGLAYNHLHRDMFTALVMAQHSMFLPRTILKSPDLLTRVASYKTEITVLHLTPALGRLLRTSTGKSLPSVRRIFFGGDVLTTVDVTLTRELALQCKGRQLLRRD